MVIIVVIITGNTWLQQSKKISIKLTVTVGRGSILLVYVIQYCFQRFFLSFDFSNSFPKQDSSIYK